jgi:DNA-binding response OmpR family regulator
MIGRVTAEVPDINSWATGHRVPLILVLQSEHFDADFLTMALDTIGFSVGAFCRNAEAIGWLDVHNPDAAIIDAGVLDGDCEEVARSLHARGVPYIVYSAVVVRGRPIEPFLKRGTFLNKPSSRLKILAAVHHALEQRSGN